MKALSFRKSLFIAGLIFISSCSLDGKRILPVTEPENKLVFNPEPPSLTTVPVDQNLADKYPVYTFQAKRKKDDTVVYLLAPTGDYKLFEMFNSNDGSGILRFSDQWSGYNSKDGGKNGYSVKVIARVGKLASIEHNMSVELALKNITTAPYNLEFYGGDNASVLLASEVDLADKAPLLVSKTIKKLKIKASPHSKVQFFKSSLVHPSAVLGGVVKANTQGDAELVLAKSDFLDFGKYGVWAIATIAGKKTSMKSKAVEVTVSTLIFEKQSSKPVFTAIPQDIPFHAFKAYDSRAGNPDVTYKLKGDDANKFNIKIVKDSAAGSKFTLGEISFKSSPGYDKNNAANNTHSLTIRIESKDNFEVYAEFPFVVEVLSTPNPSPPKIFYKVDGDDFSSKDWGREILHGGAKGKGIKISTAVASVVPGSIVEFWRAGSAVPLSTVAAPLMTKLEAMSANVKSLRVNVSYNTIADDLNGDADNGKLQQIYIKVTRGSDSVESERAHVKIYDTDRVVSLPANLKVYNQSSGTDVEIAASSPPAEFRSIIKVKVTAETRNKQNPIVFYNGTDEVISDPIAPKETSLNSGVYRAEFFPRLFDNITYSINARSVNVFDSRSEPTPSIEIKMNIPSGNKLLEYNSKSIPNAMTFSQDRRYLVLVTDNNNVYYFNIEKRLGAGASATSSDKNRDIRGSYFSTGNSAKPTAIASGTVVKHSEYYVVAAFQSGEINMWRQISQSNQKYLDLDRSISNLKWFKGHTKAVTNLVFLQGTKKLVSSSKDGTIKFWTTGGGTLLRSISKDLPSSGSEPNPMLFDGLSVSPDEKWFVAYDSSNNVLLGDIGKILKGDSLQDSLSLMTIAAADIKNGDIIQGVAFSGDSGKIILTLNKTDAHSARSSRKILPYNFTNIKTYSPETPVVLDEGRNIVFASYEKDTLISVLDSAAGVDSVIKHRTGGAWEPAITLGTGAVHAVAILPSPGDGRFTLLATVHNVTSSSRKVVIWGF